MLDLSKHFCYMFNWVGNIVSGGDVGKVQTTLDADKKSDGEISFYEAFERFQANNDVSEDDKKIFYGSVF